MGRPPTLPLERWLYHSAPIFYDILRDLALSEEQPDMGDTDKAISLERLAERARMALEATNLGGPPPWDWRTTRVV